jgi:alkanesulfonate monooxygenase SsuD/methylene tetrahydromethanopterin reductase-like flavin-dependent oxidoreductase (luciferase family)
MTPNPGVPATRRSKSGPGLLGAGFKIGLFSLNASGGIAMTRVPERWQANWDDIVEVAQLADRAGLDFLLPLQRWRGYGGETDPRGWCMETMTHAAALAGLTRQIALVATVQVPIVHPAWAARAIATLDHVSGGRAGLNVVCGWNEKDFAMFGALDVGVTNRYSQGAEWLDIFSRLIGGEGPFDHSGEYFKVAGAWCQPASLQTSGPALLSAAFSAGGREFAAKHCDILFTTVSSIEHGKRQVNSQIELAQSFGRKVVVFTPLHVVCRSTRQEAEDYYDEYTGASADDGAVDNYIAENSRSGKPVLAAAMRMQRKRIAGGFGSLGIVGSAADVAAQLIELRDAGFGGISLSFVNFKSELPYFLEAVLPLLEKAGMRTS